MARKKNNDKIFNESLELVRELNAAQMPIRVTGLLKALIRNAFTILFEMERRLRTLEERDR